MQQSDLTPAWAREALAALAGFILREGPGTLAQAPSLLRAWGVQRALVVCGQQVSRLPAVTALLAQEPDWPAGIFDAVEPDPSDTTVVAGGRLARELGAEGVLAIGGGSSLDAAKAIAAEAVQPGWIATCAPPQPVQVPAEALPVVAVPTTAGTGSEVTSFCVITFTAPRQKRALTDPAFRPRAALLDPDLIASAPRPVRVAAGMDALTHAVESYASRRATPDNRAVAYRATELIARHLPAGAAEAPEAEALAALQRAALLAGVAFSQTRLGIVHALALPVSALFGVPHGVANAILLPHGMAYNLPCAEEAYANLGSAWDVIPEACSTPLTAAAAVRAVEELAEAIGGPRRLSEVGVEQEALEQMAQDAAGSVHLEVNPRPVQPGDLEAVYRRAW